MIRQQRRFAILATLAAALATADEPRPPKIEPKAAAQAVEKGEAVLVDVREKDEIAQGMAAPARWFATSRIQANEGDFRSFLATLPKGKQVIFYCAAGARADRAARKAMALGYKVANMGGYDDWVDAKLPTRKP